MKKLIFAFIVTSFTALTALTDFQTKYQESFSLEYQKKYTQAINSLLKIYPKYQYDYELNLRLGWLNYKSGKYEESIKYLLKANNINKNALEPLNMILLPLTALGKIKEVKKYALIVLKKSPADYYANIRLAYAYYKNQNYKQALHQYKILNSFYPSDNNVKLGLAATYLKLKNFLNSRKYYLEILKTSPYHKTAYQGYLATFKKD